VSSCIRNLGAQFCYKKNSINHQTLSYSVPMVLLLNLYKGHLKESEFVSVFSLPMMTMSAALDILCRAPPAYNAFNTPGQFVKCFRIVFALISRVTRWERGILACFLWHRKYPPYSLQIAAELLFLFVPPSHPGEGGRQAAKTALGRPFFVYLSSRVTRCNSDLPSLSFLHIY